MEMRKMLYPSILAIMVAMLMFTSTETYASGTILALQEPTVRDTAGVELGNMRIEVDGGSLRKGNALVVTLPEFAAFGKAFDPAIHTEFGNKANRIVMPLTFDGQTIWDGANPPIIIRDVSDDRIVLEAAFDQPADRKWVFLIQLGDIDIESGAYGPVNVSLEASPGSGFPEGEVTVGKVYGERKTLQLSVSGFEQKENKLRFNLHIKEDQAGAFQVDHPLTLRLPSGFRWSGFGEIKAVAGQQAVLDIRGISGPELKIALRGRDQNGDGRITESERKATSEATTWEIPLEFAVVDESRVQPGEITVRAVWGTTQEISIGTYTKPEPKKLVIFQVGSLLYTDEDVQKRMDVAPYIKGERAYLPVRYAVEALGIEEKDIHWNGAAQTATIRLGEKTVQFRIGSKEYWVNGVSYPMDAVPEIKENRLMLPIRFISEAFGINIEWDGESQLIKVEKNIN